MPGLWFLKNVKKIGFGIALLLINKCEEEERKKKWIDLFWIQSSVTGLMVVAGWVWIDLKMNILFK